jgi:adenylate cyclase
MIGDTVNLASRIEGLTKLYCVEIAIGHELARRIPDYAIFEMDRVKVVGRDRPESIWALEGDPEHASSADFLLFKRKFETLLDKYRSQQWADADHLLQLLSEIPYGARFSTLLSVYRDRIAILKHQKLPADWDGVFVATEK